MPSRSPDELAALFARHGVTTQGRMGAAVLARGLAIELTQPAAGAGRYHARLTHRSQPQPGDGWGATPRDAFLQAYADWLAPLPAGSAAAAPPSPARGQPRPE
jgi:hypothetical protein